MFIPCHTEESIGNVNIDLLQMGLSRSNNLQVSLKSFTSVTIISDIHRAMW